MLSAAFTHHRSGVHQLDLIPQRVGGISDLLVQYAQPVLVIFGVSYTPWERPERAPAGLAALAHVAGVPCHAHPQADIIAIAKEDLQRFLDGFFHWNFHCWDAPRHPPLPVLAKQAEVMGNIMRRGKSFIGLHLLERAHLFVDSHDDCDLTLEARDLALVQAVFAGALERAMAGAVALTTGRHSQVTVAPVPAWLVDYFWSLGSAFALRIPETPQKPSRVRLEVGTTEKLPFWQLDFRPIGHIAYDLRAERWVHRYG